MVYVIMFWGLIKWMSYPFVHRSETKCECTCNCGYTEPTADVVENKEDDIALVEQPVMEEKKEEPKKVEVKEVKQEVKSSANTYKPGKNTYHDYAYDLVINQYAWSESDFQALVNLWNRESNWDPDAVNKSSGACNIPQALPCSKISNMYGDNSWESGIKWGLVYIKNRYGTPTAAWQHFQNKNWY